MPNDRGNPDLPPRTRLGALAYVTLRDGLGIVASLGAIVAVAAWLSEGDIRRTTREALVLQIQELAGISLNYYRGTPRDATRAVLAYKAALEDVAGQEILMGEVDLTGLSFNRMPEFDLVSTFSSDVTLVAARAEGETISLDSFDWQYGMLLDSIVGANEAHLYFAEVRGGDFTVGSLHAERANICGGGFIGSTMIFEGGAVEGASILAADVSFIDTELRDVDFSGMPLPPAMDNVCFDAATAATFPAGYAPESACAARGLAAPASACALVAEADASYQASAAPAD